MTAARLTATLAIVLVSVACATTKLTPEGEKVREITKTTGCKALGVVEAGGPFATPAEYVAVLKTKVAVLGGNALFVTVRNRAGVAYYCERAE